MTTCKLLHNARKHHAAGRTAQNDHGFTLIELIILMVILAILAVSASIKWPSGMQEDAAKLDFKRAVRYAQHHAMTQAFLGATQAWGIAVQGNQYSIRRADNSGTAGPDFTSHVLPANTTITNGNVYFNGLGEPIDPTTGTPLAANTIFTIGTGSQILVYAETGYAE